MIGLIAFNIVMLALAGALVVKLLPLAPFETLIFYLHGIVGITNPPRERILAVTLIWLGTIVLLVDGFLFLFFLLLSITH